MMNMYIANICLNTQNKSYLFLIENSLSNLLPNRSHDPTTRMRRTAADPNSPNFPTSPIGKQILNPNTAMEYIALSHSQHIFQIMRSKNIHVMHI